MRCDIAERALSATMDDPAEPVPAAVPARSPSARTRSSDHLPAAANMPPPPPEPPTRLDAVVTGLRIDEVAQYRAGGRHPEAQLIEESGPLRVERFPRAGIDLNG